MLVRATASASARHMATIVTGMRRGFTFMNEHRMFVSG